MQPYEIIIIGHVHSVQFPPQVTFGKTKISLPEYCHWYSLPVLASPSVMCLFAYCLFSSILFYHIIRYLFLFLETEKCNTVLLHQSCGCTTIPYQNVNQNIGFCLLRSVFCTKWPLCSKYFKLFNGLLHCNLCHLILITTLAIGVIILISHELTESECGWIFVRGALFGMFRIGKSKKAESRLLVARGWEE